MNRALGLALVGAGVAGLLVIYMFVTGWDAPAAVESGLQTVRDMVADAGETTPAEGAAAEDPAKPAAETPAARTARPAPAASAPSTPPATAPATEPASAAPSAAAPPPPVPRPRPLDRAANYLPGNVATWTSFGVMVNDPIVVRAGGVVSAVDDISGPGGLAAPAPATNAAPPDAGRQLVMPSAPYLALLGRVCSSSTCSEPFVIGADSTICPSTVGMTGQLQVLTNNYVRVDGRQTLSHYSSATGGFSFYTEAAVAGACAGGSPASGLGREATALAAGQVLRNPEFRIGSGQTFWKPFFLPMGGAMIVRASGTIEASGPAPATTPDGVVVPADKRWWARTNPAGGPGSGEGRLFVDDLPYHALIGRVCGAEGCGQPFLVGRERVLCPAAPYTDRLELWINRVIRAPRMLERQTPLTFEMFEVQTRKGGYAFEVAPAGAGACGGPGAR